MTRAPGIASAGSLAGGAPKAGPTRRSKTGSHAVFEPRLDLTVTGLLRSWHLPPCPVLARLPIALASPSILIKDAIGPVTDTTRRESSWSFEEVLDRLHVAL